MNKNVMKQLDVITGSDDKRIILLNKVLLNKKLLFSYERTRTNFNKIYLEFNTLFYTNDNKHKDYFFKFNEKENILTIKYPNADGKIKTSKFGFTKIETDNMNDNTCKEISWKQFLGIEEDDDNEDQEENQEETPVLDETSEEEEEEEKEEEKEEPKPEPKPEPKKEKPKKLTKEERIKLEKERQRKLEEKREEHKHQQLELLKQNPDNDMEGYIGCGYSYIQDAEKISALLYTKNIYKKNPNNDIYSNKKYTLFLTEEELDCIAEGLELLQEKRSMKGADVPCEETRCRNTLHMIKSRLCKIKNNITKGKQWDLNNSSMKWKCGDDY